MCCQICWRSDREQLCGRSRKAVIEKLVGPDSRLRLCTANGDLDRSCRFVELLTPLYAAHDSVLAHNESNCRLHGALQWSWGCPRPEWLR